MQSLRDWAVRADFNVSSTRDPIHKIVSMDSGAITIKQNKIHPVVTRLRFMNTLNYKDDSDLGQYRNSANGHNLLGTILQAVIERASKASESQRCHDTAAQEN